MQLLPYEDVYVQYVFIQCNSTKTFSNTCVAHIMEHLEAINFSVTCGNQ